MAHGAAVRSKYGSVTRAAAYCGFSLSGVGFCYSVKQHESYVELRIDRNSTHENKDVFDRLCASRDEIELSFGGRLNWDRLDGFQHSRIGVVVPGGYADAESQWHPIHMQLVDSMTRLKRAFDAHLDNLQT